MTCRDRLNLEHPEMVNSMYPGGCKGCPNTYGYLPSPGYCFSGFNRCEDCWDREMSEPEKKETTIDNYIELICMVIEDALKRRDQSVNITVNSDGIDIRVSPITTI